MKTKNSSKFLSLILRHKPETIGITLDNEGWVSINVLLKALNKHSQYEKWNREKLEHIVETNDKKRFYIDKEFDRIRANQGHSIDIKIKYKESIPTGPLFHGTVQKYIDSIYEQGLHKMNRHHVHLSKDVDTAKQVGSRRGKPVILVIDAEQMHHDGFKFFISENGVWLTDHVPSKYILNLIHPEQWQKN